MNKDSIKADFLSANAKTSITILNATGWREGTVNPEVVGQDCVFFYVFDYQTEWTWCCSVPKDSFFELLKKLAGEKSALDRVVIATCSHMISTCALAADMDQSKETDLAVSLSAYIRITRSYQLTEQATKQNHFVVIRYGKTDTIRPFAMGGSLRHLIPSREIFNAVKQVIAMDSKNHPEWISD